MATKFKSHKVLDKPISVRSFLGRHECWTWNAAIKTMQMIVNANKARKAAAS